MRTERGRPIISFASEWDRYGKPVTVKEIKVADVPVYAKFTVISNSDKSAMGFVTADIKDRLKVGQDVYLAENNVPCGKILRLGENLDINTGMFSVEIELDTPLAVPGSALVIFAQTETLRRTLVVPNSILDISQDNYCLRKIENGKAKKTQVEIGLRNGYGTVIKKGIHSGDLIVFSGQNLLGENDKVNIFGEDNCAANRQ